MSAFYPDRTTLAANLVGDLIFATDANDEVQARLVSAYWVDFAATGDPNGDDRPHWPRYSPEADELLDFASTGATRRPTPFAERLDAIPDWRRAASPSH